MYEAFFGLNQSPFEISPDPRFLYPTGQHYEALANLYYAIRKRKGFAVLTGEVGTGKTLLVRCLLEKLEKQRVKYSYIFNPSLTPVEFLRYVAADLGVEINWKDKSDLLLGLSRFLVRQNQQGMTTVLVVDEAHLLSCETLEEIRLLNNLETSRGKLLQMVLVGQPEMDEKLDSAGLRQLKQRIVFRCQLQPLSMEETQEYVTWRLKRAGAQAAFSLFPPDTIQTIHQYSRGCPRLINTLCENALISAYAAETHTITAGMIKEACTDLRISASPAGSHPEAETKETGQHPELDCDDLLRDPVVYLEAARETKPRRPQSHLEEES